MGSGVPNTDDLNNALCLFVDNPNNEVRTFSDSPYILTRNVAHILSQYQNSAFSLKMLCMNSKFDSHLESRSHFNENKYNFDVIC